MVIKKLKVTPFEQSTTLFGKEERLTNESKIFSLDFPYPTLAKLIKGVSLPFFTKFSRPSKTKISEISINTVEQVEQLILLTTCTTKLHRYYRVTLHSLAFQQKKIPEIPSPLLLPSPE